MMNEDVREVLHDAEGRMKGAIVSLEYDLAGFRTGRASPQLIERLVVEMYGVEMELKQMAVISVPEPQQLGIRPYDANSISAIEPRPAMHSSNGRSRPPRRSAAGATWWNWNR
jgi:ribosome recycling factor